MGFSMKISLALFLVVGAYAQQHDSIVPEETELAEDGAAFEEAKKYIGKLLQSGKTGSQCRNLAQEMKKTVRNNVQTQQKILDGMPRGKACGSRGQQQIIAAKQRLAKAKKNLRKMTAALIKAEDINLNFGNFKYKQLSEGKCGSFFNQGVWRRAKAAVQAARRNKKTASTTIVTATKGVKDAKSEAKRLVKKCKCRVKRALEKALKTMNSKAKTSNTAAWVKASHLMCVVQGKKTLKNCRITNIPTVKQVSFSPGVKNACGGKWKSSGSYKVKNAAGQMVRFTLVRMPATKGWKRNNLAAKKRYIRQCADHGMVPVGCGNAASTNCRTKQGASKCMGLPSAFSCQTTDQIITKTGNKVKGGKYGLITYYVDGGGTGGTVGKTSSWPTFYSPRSSTNPSPSKYYHAVCGKYGTANGY